MQKIIVAVDFSPLSAAVIRYGVKLASAFSARVVLLHAAAPDPDFVGYEVGPQNVRDARAETLRFEHRELQRLADQLRGQGLNAEAMLVEGPTVDTILSVAATSGADLLVVGSHGHGAVARAFLGSVSTGIVHHSPIPVMVIPAPGREPADG